MRGVCMKSHLQQVQFSHAYFKEDLTYETKLMLSITLAARNFFLWSVPS